jgi:hypothetical protein
VPKAIAPFSTLQLDAAGKLYAAVPSRIPGDGNTVLLCTDAKKLWLTRNYLSTPTWTDITPSGVGANFYPIVVLFAISGASAYLLALPDAVSQPAQSAVWKTDNVFATPVVWSQGATQTGVGIFSWMTLTPTAGEILIGDLSDNPAKVRFSSNGGTYWQQSVS